jgi:hypothetical protein
LLITVTTGETLELFPRADPNADLFGHHQVAQHLDEYLELRIRIAHKEVPQPRSHLIVQFTVGFGDESATYGMMEQAWTATEPSGTRVVLTP